MIVFIDTSALYAVFDRSDAMHECAREEWVRLLSGHDSVLTSNYILVETFALIQRRLGAEAIAALRDDVLPVLQVEWVSPEIHEEGLRLLMADGRRKLSFVDCTSFVTIRRGSVDGVFCFDRHFREQGFAVLPSQDQVPSPDA